MVSSQEIASFKDQEPFTCTDVLAETYARLMELVLKRCENAFDNEVYVDLSTVADVKALMSKYNLIQVTETKDQPMVVTGHTHNHQVMPPIVVSLFTCVLLYYIVLYLSILCYVILS